MTYPLYTFYRDVRPLSPLPPVITRPGDGEGREGGEVYVDGVGFSLVPRSPVKTPRVELQGEEVRRRFMNWPKDNLVMSEREAEYGMIMRS
jgi:hypothetical protein